MNMLEKYEKEMSGINERAKKDIPSYTKAVYVCNQYIFDEHNGFFKAFGSEDLAESINLPTINEIIDLKNSIMFSYRDRNINTTTDILERIKTVYDNSTVRIERTKKLFKDLIANEPEVYKAIQDICGIEKRVLSGLSDDQLSISANKPYMPKSKYFNLIYNVYYDNKIKILDKDYCPVDVWGKYREDAKDIIVRRNGSYSLSNVTNKIKRRVNKLSDLIRFISSELNNIDNSFNNRLSKELNKDIEKSKTVYRIALEEVKSIVIRLKSKYNSLLSNELIKENIIDGVL